ESIAPVFASIFKVASQHGQMMVNREVSAIARSSIASMPRHACPLPASHARHDIPSEESRSASYGVTTFLIVLPVFLAPALVLSTTVFVVSTVLLATVLLVLLVLSTTVFVVSTVLLATVLAPSLVLSTTSFVVSTVLSATVLTPSLVLPYASSVLSAAMPAPSAIAFPLAFSTSPVSDFRSRTSPFLE